MPAPTAREKRDLFKDHALLGKLPPEHLDALLLRARVERFAAGSEIFSEGSAGRSMMAILSGSVRISASSRGGHAIVLSILQPGEVFGEIALIDGRNRTADATAIADSQLLVLDHRDFLPFLERRADLCILLLKLLCQRLREADRQIAEIMFGRLEDRLAKALTRLAKGAMTPGSDGRAATLRISQQELAGMVGASRESVNKLLRLWASEGLLGLGKRLIEIPDIASIAKLL
jgi:CRP/FNR family cyclic AMP-dependent transcriptional regulator